jgi:cytochrome c
MSRFVWASAAAFCALVGATAVASAQDAGDPAKGESVFRRCAACHSLTAGENKVGPSLHGLFGRTPGTVEGFNYSDAMKAHGGVWDAATLDVYLENPRKTVPGTIMSFPGLKKPEDRANLIAYLQQATQ